MNAKDALEKTRTVKAQTHVDIVKGMTLRRTRGGIPVVRLHYSADPERDPEITPAWKATERRKYTSQADWDREQEIRDDAGGGELVFADTLITYANLIIIKDPAWRPPRDKDNRPIWKVGGGFDHGKTNPTCLEKAYIDFDGNIYFCGEYYQRGKEIWENAPEILKMPDLEKMEICLGDPSIFPQTVEQSQSGPTKAAPERAKSINELYEEQGVKFIQPFYGDRSDISFAGRMNQHWANLDQRRPSLYIVCRNESETPQYGLHPWDCPNLLWELRRARRVKLTSQQLMSKNQAEALVDKDNHARDAAKYFVMSLPEPTFKTPQQIIAERLKAQELDLTSASIRAAQYKDEMESSSQAPTIGRRQRRR